MAMRVLLSFAILFALVSWGTAADAQLPAEAYQGWQKLAEATTDVEGRFDLEQTDPVDVSRLPTAGEDLRFGKWQDGILLEVKRLGVSRTLVASTEYAFAAVRTGHNETFVLEAFYDGVVASSVRQAVDEKLEPLLSAGFAIECKKISELLKGEGTELRSLNIDGKSGIATLEFEMGRNERAPELLSGVVNFQTKHDWVILGYECKTTWGGEVRCKNTYRSFDGTSVPETVHHRIHGPDGTLIRERVYRLTAISKAEDRKTLVTLEGYNLTRPDWAKRRMNKQ